MRIAILSDIHGNIEALNSVLSEIPSDVDHIICLGDVVGYGPKPKQCVDKIRSTTSLCLKGNHEKALVQSQSFNSVTARAGLEHARNQLHSEDYNWLKTLNSKVEDNNNNIAFHSHPDEDVTKHIYPSDIESAFDGLFEDYEYILYGHTHHPVVKSVNNSLIVNPGSVGQPRDGNKKASFAILNTDNKEAQIKRLDYNINKTIDQIETENLPDETKDRIRNAR